MSSPLAHQAEILRLARVLGVDADELAFLADAPVEDLKAVRAAVLDRLLERSRAEFERAVALGDKVPRGLAATLAQRAMGPVLGGRAAALLNADMAADLAGRLPVEFLADVASHVDLRHVGPLIGGIPIDTMAACGRVLREREEWIVLSAFVGDVPQDKLEILLDLFDGEALLRAGFVIEDVDRLDDAVRLLPAARLNELFTVAHEQGLWPEALSLATHIGPDQGRRIVAAIDELPASHLDGLLIVADEHGLWAEAITVAAHVGDDGRGGGAILQAIERLPPERLDALLVAADDHGLWPQVLRVALLARGTDDGALVPEILGRADPERLERVAAVLTDDATLRTSFEPLLADAPDHLRTLLVL